MDDKFGHCGYDLNHIRFEEVMTAAFVKRIHDLVCWHNLRWVR